MVLSRNHVVQKRVKLRSCRKRPVFPKAMQVCVGEALAFLIVDLTFHGHWHICQVRAWLASHPSLATRKDATVEVVLATCHKCSSKRCLLFGPFGPTSLQQKRLRKNHNFGTATS